MAKKWRSPKRIDEVAMAIIATVVIAILFSWLSEIICIASGLLFFILLFVLTYLWETVDLEYDARKAAREMKKINTDENHGWKELLLHGDFKALALRKGPKTAATIYFLTYFGFFFIAAMPVYIFYHRDYTYSEFLMIFAVFFLIQAYGRKNIYDLALEMLKKGETEEYREPEPTFPIGEKR